MMAPWWPNSVCLSDAVPKFQFNENLRRKTELFYIGGMSHNS